MKKIKCFQCDFVAKGADAYHTHRADHKSGKIKLKIPNRPDSIGSMPMPDELKGTLIPKKKEKPVKTDPTPQPKSKPVDKRTPPKVKAEAPRLEYHYEGNCIKCGHEVETLTLDDVAGKDKVVVVAWCPEHKKQRQTITHKL